MHDADEGGVGDVRGDPLATRTPRAWASRARPDQSTFFTGFMPSQVPFAAAAAALFTLAQMSDACCWPASVRRCHALPGAGSEVRRGSARRRGGVAGGGGEAGARAPNCVLAATRLPGGWRREGGKFGEEVGDG